ncbi:MAG: Cysteine protease atg4 [Piccolia ochrophora]|nr:MAG: Cysteine protease atg4 [Piccolia ochrophora]
MSNVDFGKARRWVQNLWDPEPQNDDDSNTPMWCLGQEYVDLAPPKGDLSNTSSISNDSTPVMVDSHPSPGSSSTPVDSTSSSLVEGLAYEEPNGRSAEDRGWPRAFIDDIEARIWLTYRSNFPPIPKSEDPKATSAMTLAVRLRSQLVDQGGFTSDTGWGCMIRSGQSLLANALVMLDLGRDWRRGSSIDVERKLLSLFADDPHAPFSIHRFVEHGASACGKHPGEWFGPSATARCIQALCNDRADTPLKVYITSDGSDVYEDGFLNIARPAGAAFQPTLILVGIRLGIDRVTPVYWEALKAALQMPQSIGIAGGRPSSSHYFIGVQGSHFFYLDPHHTRPALPLHAHLADYTPEEVDSCHTRRLRRLHISEMDPSMLIAFLIRDEADWDAWKQGVAKVPGKAVIHVAKGHTALHGQGSERQGAVDEVEILDDEDDVDDDDENDTVTVSADSASQG